MTVKNTKDIKKNVFSDESGQTFLEFILLFMVVLMFSYLVLRGINTNMADRWKQTIQIIADPTDTAIEFAQ